eukprot:464660_1
MNSFQTKLVIQIYSYNIFRTNNCTFMPHIYPYIVIIDLDDDHDHFDELWNQFMDFHPGPYGWLKTPVYSNQIELTGAVERTIDKIHDQLLEFLNNYCGSLDITHEILSVDIYYQEVECDRFFGTVNIRQDWTNLEDYYTEISSIIDHKFIEICDELFESDLTKTMLSFLMGIEAFSIMHGTVCNLFKRFDEYKVMEEWISLMDRGDENYFEVDNEIICELMEFISGEVRWVSEKKRTYTSTSPNEECEHDQDCGVTGCMYWTLPQDWFERHRLPQEHEDLWRETINEL